MTRYKQSCVKTNEGHTKGAKVLMAGTNGIEFELVSLHLNPMVFCLFAMADGDLELEYAIWT